MKLFESTNPWEPLHAASKPGSILMRGCSVRYVHSLYLGIDKQQRYLLLLKLPEKNASCDIKDFPNLKGTSLELLRIQDYYYFTLALNNSKDWRIFQFLCQIIVSEIEKEERQDNKVLLKSMYKILKKCTTFFGRNGANFTREQALGLLGELYFLKECSVPATSWEYSLNAWKGPLGYPQDFLYPDSAIEIKTSEMSQKNLVRISNVEQLAPYQIKGYLYVINVIEAAGDAWQTAISLNELVEEITEQLSTQGMDIDAFKVKLEFTGYTPSSKHSSTRYHIAAEQCYVLNDNFPRINPEALQKGVENVKYSLNLAYCGDFKTTLDTLKL